MFFIERNLGLTFQKLTLGLHLHLQVEQFVLCSSLFVVGFFLCAELMEMSKYWKKCGFGQVKECGMGVVGN